MGGGREESYGKMREKKKERRGRKCQGRLKRGAACVVKSVCVGGVEPTALKWFTLECTVRAPPVASPSPTPNLTARLLSAEQLRGGGGGGGKKKKHLGGGGREGAFLPMTNPTPK